MTTGPLRPINFMYYGDETRWFIGTVINAVPPAGFEGRVRVRIHGVHDPETSNVPEVDLPWAQVMISATEGGSSGIGRSPQLVAGAQVFGIFMDGRHSQVPLVMGVIHRDEFPSDIQKGVTFTSETSYNKQQSRLQNVVIEELRDDDLESADITLRRLQGMKFFIDNGYSPLHAAAIVANLQVMSSFKLLTVADDRVGIAGWMTTGKRFKNLREFAILYEPPATTLSYSLQLQFVLYELRNDLLLANKLLLQSNEIEKATNIVSKYYIKSIKQATNIAKQAYDEVYL